MFDSFKYLLVKKIIAVALELPRQRHIAHFYPLGIFEPNISTQT